MNDEPFLEPDPDQIEHIARSFTDDGLVCQTDLVEELIRRGQVKGVPTNWNRTDRPVDEWWLVCDELAIELGLAGQIVVTRDARHWWGRRATGRSFHSDRVFRDIAYNRIVRWS